MERWTVEQVWDALANYFDRDTVAEYRASSTDADAAFRKAKNAFRNEIAELTPGDHDINRDGAKQRLILGHLILSILDGIKRGVSEWRPFPHLDHLNWAQRETALLLWAAQHGTSDDHAVQA